MKKIIFLVCCLCIIGGFSYFLSRPAPPKPPQNYYAHFLPDDVVAVLSLYDMEGLSTAFPGTPLGRFLSKPVMHEIMGELGGTDEDLEKYDAFYNAVADVMTSPIFRQVFGDDAVIALCPPDPERLQDNPEQELKNSILAFGTSSSAGPIGRFARLVMRKDMTNAEVAGLDMTRIRLDENEMLYGYDDQGIIVLAYDPRRIVSAVERKATGKNLRHAESFTATESFWKEERTGQLYAHAYLNAISLQELVSAFTQEKGQQAAETMTGRVTEELAGIKSIGGVIIENQGELRLRMKGEVNPKSLPNQVQEVQAGEVLSDNEDLALSLLQANTLLHYRLSHFDKAFFRNFLASAKTKQQYSELEKTVQDEVGFSLNKFLEAVGPQAGISVHEIVNAGMFPLPKTILALKVQDKKAVGWALKKLRGTLKKQGLVNERQEKIQGHRFYYWTIMPVEASHLAIALTDTMLYIANGESQLRTLLEGAQDPKTLADNMVKELGETAGTCVATANSDAFLLRPERLAGQLAPIADWLTNMLWASRTGSGRKMQEEVLTLMRSFDFVAACSDLVETHVRAEVIFKTLPKTGEEKE
ncbi:hypothetical protein H206_00335 [Candidatus Electrothrix aarhusensis]|jgi:hypothetical protein|uniref:DUF3352 domain-containing protein n=1 Tax=Candidatus Electrothrix aarhusensis TaxID=1859131 RepID=A0A444IZT2_9BACT|nr:hypothetical protein H206_00335 [Candidatus Electrothrix aarhusensis]